MARLTSGTVRSAWKRSTIARRWRGAQEPQRVFDDLGPRPTAVGMIRREPLRRSAPWWPAVAIAPQFPHRNHVHPGGRTIHHRHRSPSGHRLGECVLGRVFGITQPAARQNQRADDPGVVLEEELVEVVHDPPNV